VAPNLITLVGLIINVIGTLTYMYHDVTCTELMPSWVIYFGVFCSFMYQTLDAVDGKQARRTGTSSPLGQLFDHGRFINPAQALQDVFDINLNM
jgi:phosphatidylglycerophosphate synthase